MSAQNLLGSDGKIQPAYLPVSGGGGGVTSVSAGPGVSVTGTTSVPIVNNTGMLSLNSLAGNVSLVGAGGLTVTPAGSSITLTQAAGGNAGTFYNVGPIQNPSAIPQVDNNTFSNVPFPGTTQALVQNEIWMVSAKCRLDTSPATDDPTKTAYFVLYLQDSMSAIVQSFILYETTYTALGSQGNGTVVFKVPANVASMTMYLVATGGTPPLAQGTVEVLNYTKLNLV